MSLRPSKKSLYSYLKKDLNRFGGALGVDAASANMKNRWRFKTERYLGVDCSIDLLRQGLKDKTETYGLCASITELDCLENSADVCVSTNTLEHLSDADQVVAMENLIKITKPGGTLLFNKHRDTAYPALNALIMKRFREVETVYYRNYFSQYFESKYPPEEVPGYLRWLVTLLGLIERATQKSRWFNECVYHRCRGKERTAPDQTAPFERLEEIEPHLFRIPQSARD